MRTRPEVALYVLNHKRAHLRDLEERFRITITISADATVNAQVPYAVDRGEQMHTVEAAKALAAAAQPPLPSMVEADEDVLDAAAETDDDVEAESESYRGEVSEAPEFAPAEDGGETPRDGGERDGRRRRRRGRGRGRGRGGETREGAPPFARETVSEHAVAHEDHEAGAPEEIGLDEQQPRQGVAPEDAEGGEIRRRRRRGRRGGRRNRQGREGEAPFQANNGGGPEREAQHAGAEFPPVSDEDASAIAPPFDEPATERPIIDRPYNEPQFAAPELKPAAPPQAAAAAPSEPEPPRRRSTIREPAPIAVAGAPPPAPVPSAPPPAPIVSSTASEETGQPKRGWWAKRLLGDKS